MGWGGWVKPPTPPPLRVPHIFLTGRPLWECQLQPNSFIFPSPALPSLPYSACMSPNNWLIKSQGWEFAHRFFEWITRFLWAKERFTFEKEQIAPVPLLSWAPGANCSGSHFYKERWEQFAHGCFFVKWDKSESLPHSLKKSDWAKSNGSASLLDIKRGRAVKNCQKHTKIWIVLSEALIFVKSNKSDLLTPALFKRATGANCSQSLNNMSDLEQKSEFPAL